VRPDGTLELWDEYMLPQYRELAKQIDPATGHPYRQRRNRGARVQDLFIFMREALAAYQSYYVVNQLADFRGWFQFARYLEVGDKVRNLTTGDEYEVKEKLLEPDGTYCGEVILTGTTSPTETDRLMLEDRNLIVFSHAAPRSEVASSNFDESTERVDETAPFNDTIEFSITRSEPGTVGKKPFAADRQALPLLREGGVDDLIDPGIANDIYGWWFDHIVQFDLFSRNWERLYGSRRVDGKGTVGLVTWFQDFMQRYRWVFLWNGIQQLLEWQGTQDEPIGRWRNDMLHRPLMFYVRTERISLARVRRIEQIDVLVNIGAPPELAAQTGCPAPTGQITAVVNDLGLYNTLGG
jgi:hypothetical protein